MPKNISIEMKLSKQRSVELPTNIDIVEGPDYCPFGPDLDPTVLST